MIEDVEHPFLGKLKGLKAAGFPLKFSASKTGNNIGAIPSGTNNNENFKGLLGLNESDIKKLEADRII